MQRALIKLDTQVFMFLVERFRTMRFWRVVICRLNAFLMCFAKIFHRIPVGAYFLIPNSVDNIHIRICFTVGLIQFLALVSSRGEQASVLC